MADSPAGGAAEAAEAPPRRMILNAFDMFTPSHLNFGQWRRADDRSATKRRDLGYWTELAQTLERGDITALVLADTYGYHDVYRNSAEPTLRTACQFPVGDPAAPVTAMAAVTKRLGFVVTTSTSYEAPYVVARRFSTLDHLTGGRFGWNIVTSFQESAARAMGQAVVAHDERYKAADEFVTLLYKLWEGSWADDALREDAEKEVYTDFGRVRWIQHTSTRFSVDAPHLVDPSPQRTPFLLQAGTSAAGMAFAATHAEAVMISGLSPHLAAPRVAALRAQAAVQGRDPRSLKVLALVTPVLGRTDAAARAKYETAVAHVSAEAALAFYSGLTGIDLARFPLDVPLTPDDAAGTGPDRRVQSLVDNLGYRGDDVPPPTPRNLGRAMALGGNGPVPVGTPAAVADALEEWVRVADVDGFCLGAVVSPGSFVDVVDLLVPELRRRGLYPSADEAAAAGPTTLRERIYGAGQPRLRDDHVGSRYAYDRYVEE